MTGELDTFKRHLRKEMREMKISMNFFNKEFESMKKECTELKNENASLRATQEMLLQEIAALKKKVQENALSVTAQEQYSRNKNIEIKGIPRESNENLEGILGKVGDLIGEPIRKDDIETCHRLPVRGADSDPNIVVVFNNRAKRDAIIEKARKSRFTTSDIGYTKKQSVYVNEHLCPRLKKLLGMTIAKKRELNWRFAWAKGGKVYARQTETSRIVRIACEADLEKMFDTTSTR